MYGGHQLVLELSQLAIGESDFARKPMQQRRLMASGLTLLCFALPLQASAFMLCCMPAAGEPGKMVWFSKGLSKGSRAGSSTNDLRRLSLVSTSSASSASMTIDSSTKLVKPNPMQRCSLPAMHLQEQRDTFQNSCAMMANPPVFNNPLRRRGCCDHNYAEELSSYRAEAIERELLAKQCNLA